MQIAGFKIHMVGIPSTRVTPAGKPGGHGHRRGDSAETRSLAWLLLEAEPTPRVNAALRIAVMEGNYLVPAPVLSRALVEHMIWTRP